VNKICGVVVARVLTVAVCKWCQSIREVMGNILVVEILHLEQY
jgi:hypothetical protein